MFPPRTGALTITRFAPSSETATKTPLPYVTAFHVLSSVAAVAVHVMASRLYITLFVPVVATATKRPWGELVTDIHLFCSAAERAIQSTPFVDVITRFVPLEATATKRLLPAMVAP